MQHSYSLEEISLQNSWITIGSFDGVHLGHQKIIHELVEGAHAAGVPAAVLTFHPHPVAVLRDRQDPFYLSSPDERAEQIANLGVDTLITHPFTHATANLTALEFMTLVKRHLGLTHLWVGHDFALGRGREGDVRRLRQLGEELGYKLNVVPPVTLNEPVTLGGEVISSRTISSSLIRSALAAGDTILAEKLLGRPYQIGGSVVSGDGRGRTIGIPTANLDSWSLKMLPKVGVYVCQAHIDGLIWGAVANVGFRPTFENQPAAARVEAHVLELNQDLYGKSIRLDFFNRLRDEQRFSGIEALVSQIRRDIEQARESLQMRIGASL